MQDGKYLKIMWKVKDVKANRRRWSQAEWMRRRESFFVPNVILKGSGGYGDEEVSRSFSSRRAVVKAIIRQLLLNGKVSVSAAAWAEGINV